jgi:hypothetical protein
LTRAAAAQFHLQNNSITRWAKKGLIKKRAPEFPGAIYSARTLAAPINCPTRVQSKSKLASIVWCGAAAHI